MIMECFINHGSFYFCVFVDEYGGAGKGGRKGGGGGGGGWEGEGIENVREGAGRGGGPK